MSKHRLQLDFTGKALDDLDSLKESTDLPNRAEVIRQALRLLQWTVHETRDNGGKLLLERDGTQREVIFPLWNSRSIDVREQEREEVQHARESSAQLAEG